jgi:hypothetical protein
MPFLPPCFPDCPGYKNGVVVAGQPSSTSVMSEKPHASSVDSPGKTATDQCILSHADQYKMLREEIMFRQQEINRVQAWAVITVGAVYAWLLTHPQNPVLSYAYYLVPFLLMLCALHTGESTLRIMHIARYLTRIEEAAFGPSQKLPGWERYKRSRNGIAVISSAAMAFAWAAMITASIIVAIKLRCPASSQQPSATSRSLVATSPTSTPSPLKISTNIAAPAQKPHP